MEKTDPEKKIVLVLQLAPDNQAGLTTMPRLWQAHRDDAGGPAELVFWLVVDRDRHRCIVLLGITPLSSRRICITSLVAAGLNLVRLKVLHASGSQVSSRTDFHASIGGESGVTVTDFDLLIVSAVIQEIQGHLDALSTNFEARLRRRLDESLSNILARIQLGSSLDTRAVDLRVRQIDVSGASRLGLESALQQAPTGTDGHGEDSERAHLCKWWGAENDRAEMNCP